jgi:uncharacterized glyoxalase superfamily protein PhnB
MRRAKNGKRAKAVTRVKAVKNVKGARAKAAQKAPARGSAAKSAGAGKAAGGFQLTSMAPSLTVNDVVESMTWYCDVLGFTVKQRWEHGGEFVGAELHAGRAVLYIGRDDWQMGRDRVKGQGFRLYWYTDQDIDRLAAAIVARGGSLASEPRDEYGMRSFNLVDPTGYKIPIGSNR